MLSNFLPSTCLLYIAWICVFCHVHARPSDIFSPDTQNDDGIHLGFGVWVAAAAGFVVVSVSLALCVCCRKPKGFAEFRSSTQLAEISSGQPAEVTLFPPPSLSLNREDLEISFEPLPRPHHQAANTYRPKEVTEWIENGQGLFPRCNIQYLREVGRGWFGQVVEAEVKDLVVNQLTSRCVVKILRPEASASQHSMFLKEVQLLLKLDHPHVLKLYGCCLETSPFLVLLQHCANGDLKQFLAAYSPSKGTQGVPPLPENVLLRMACEAAEGLSQWHQTGFSHPDVAARSYMVTGDMSVVIGDYGTHTVTYREEYLDAGHQLLPIRWCAPEYFDTPGEIYQTLAGNVWSFGVVLWEILSIGSRPYAALTDEQVLQQVIQEKRTILNPPSFNYQQSQALYQLMLHCWEVDAPLRPRMEVVASHLAAACAGVNRDVELDLERAFDSRWNAAKPSKSSLSELDDESPSASLNNLHGSLDNLAGHNKEILSPGTDKESESGYSAKVSAALRSLDEALAAAEATDEEEDDDDDILPGPSFQFGDLQADQAEAGQETDHSSDSNGSLFSSRSWQEKVVRGELTAMVREKSRSVQDLMVLTAVEPMSDIEFLSFNQPSKPDQQENVSQPIAPQISVTSPSFTVRSPMMESDVPLLESNDSNNGKDSLDTGTYYLTRNRNRLTSTPREDTDFEAMESSFRDQTKPSEYAPFSPESLDATDFTSKDQGSARRPPENTDSSTSVILGPSDELGLHVFQGVTSRTQSEDENPFDESEGAASVPINAFAVEDEEPTPTEPARLAVNLEAWKNFLEQSYPQHPSEAEHHNIDVSDTPLQLKDSGIARPSFSTSVDVLGSTLGNEDSVNREWMDDLSLVARMWNEELAAALALDSSAVQQPHQLNASLTDTDPNLEDGVANISSLSNDVSYISPSKREDTYFSYDKIDDDIREQEERAVRRKDLSTIREERESVSSSEMGATPNNNADTGRGLLSQLQLKNRMQRHLDVSGSSDSDGSDDCRDDDEDVLIVDLENKRAVMMEGQSPKLKAAIASQNYEEIFAVRPTNVHSIMENGKSPLYNRKDPPNGALLDEIEKDNDHDIDDEDEGGAEEEEEGDDGEIVNDFEDDDEDDEEEGDEGIAVSNFRWQACYPAKLNQSFSMEVIEEESENEDQEDDEEEAFVPSIWRADATPTRPAIKTPEKSLGNSPCDNIDKKNVSFSQKKKKDIYQYPAEVEEFVPPTRRQWGAPTPVIQQPESAYADFADWDFGNADEDRESMNDNSKDLDELKTTLVIPRPPNPLTSNMLYRLSGIENESDEDEDDKEQNAILPEFDARPNESLLLGDWQSPFNTSEFQPNQFFPNWDNPVSLIRGEESVDVVASNGHDHGNEEPKVVGTLRHTLDSGRLRLDLTQPRFEDSEA